MVGPVIIYILCVCVEGRGVGNCFGGVLAGGGDKKPLDQGGVIYFIRYLQGMQSRDSCAQREQASALRYCLQEP